MSRERAPLRFVSHMQLAALEPLLFMPLYKGLGLELVLVPYFQSGNMISSIVDLNL